MRKMDMLNSIQKIWSAYEQPNIISFETYDDEGSNEYFQGTKFDEHSLDDLLNHSSSLIFLTDGAFRYYLASYLIALVKYGEDCDVIIDYIESELSAPKGNIERPSYANRVGKLSMEQKKCTLCVLEELAKSGLIQSDSLAIESFRKLCN